MPPPISRTPAPILQAFRRDQILDAAREVIGAEGYDRCSVEQIAKRAGLSRSTVYEYFPSKKEILEGCFAARREVIAEEFARKIDRAEGIEAQLAAFIEICFSRVDQNRDFFLAMAVPLPLDEAAASEGPGGTEFARVIKDFNDAVERILDAGYRRGDLARPVSPDDRHCLGALIVGAMGARGRKDAPAPAGKSATHFARFALRGLGYASR